MPEVPTVEIPLEEYKLIRTLLPSNLGPIPLDGLLPDRDPTGTTWVFPWWAKWGLIAVGVMLTYSLANRAISKLIV